MERHLYHQNSCSEYLQSRYKMAQVKHELINTQNVKYLQQMVKRRMGPVYSSFSILGAAPPSGRLLNNARNFKRFGSLEVQF